MGKRYLFLIVKGSDLQNPELAHGLQPKTVAVQFASRWQTIRTPDGKDLWLKMDTGQTQYTSPFVAEIKADSSVLAEEPTAYWGEATDPANAVVRPEVVVFQPPVDQPVQVRDSLTKTVPKARIIPNQVVMSTSGAQYDRWKQATCKELQAFLETAWKESTPELRSRYFASKKKVKAPKSWEEARDKTLTSFVFQIDHMEYSLRQSAYHPSLWFVVRAPRQTMSKKVRLPDDSSVFGEHEH